MNKHKRPQILLTGAGGQLAQHVIKKLRKEYQIIGIDFRQESHYDDPLIHYRLDYSKRGFEDIFKTHQFDGVIHLGRIHFSQANRFRRYNTNVLGMQKLLDLSLKYNVNRVIVLSTYHVYGADPYNPALIDEGFPLKASNLSSELVDAVEVENVTALYKWKYPELNLTVLRPCNVAGPGVRNTISSLLKNRFSPYLTGFSPMMQFLHVEDLAEAIVKAYKQDCPGVYNVAMDDWVPYKKALELAGVTPVPMLSIPPMLPKQVFRSLKLKHFPPYLINYYKYPVVLDASLFNETFDFKPRHSLKHVLHHYAQKKHKA